MQPDGSPPSWHPGDPGVLVLPSGRRVRGRALRRPLPTGPAPTFALYLAGKRPPVVGWEAQWLRWLDFRLPADHDEALGALRATWERLAHDRVEIACAGGRGRTGTALACLVVIDAGHDIALHDIALHDIALHDIAQHGIDAVAYVRQHYDRHAVETPWQRRYVARFPTA